MRTGTAVLLFALVPLVLAASAAPAAAADRHAFTVQDLVTLQRIADPQVSPDGKQVVFALRTTDLEANKGRYDLWLTAIDGSGQRQLTFTPESESNAVWSRDGKAILFLRGGQVYRLPLDGGEARKVTDLALDVDAFSVTPDGKAVIAGVSVFPDCANDKAGAIACTKARMDAKEKVKASGRLYTQLFFRHWDEWADGRRAHLFVVPLGGGPVVDLLKTMDADCPTKPFGGPEDWSVSPDGQHVVFSAKDVGREEAWSTNYDLFMVPLDGSAAPSNRTAANNAWDAGPAFAPDGRTLAYRAMTRAGYEADRFRIVLRPIPAGAPDREIAKDWDRSPGEVLWSPDSKTLFVTSDNLGHHALFAIDAASGAVRTVIKEGTVSAVRLAGDRLLVAINSLLGPDDLYTVNFDGSGLKQITHVNAAALDTIAFGQPEQFTFKGALGDTVYAWIVRPANFDPAKKYPVAFLIHGGPQGSFGNDFHYRWNPQTYAGRGYAAVMVDFHGSTGYGQKFTDGINGDWGGKPLEDLQKGLAAALEKYPWMDGTHVSALGASYGGYMINWIEGAWPDRFRCLVAHDGNLDEKFAYYDTEELWFPEWEHGGTPWDNPQGYTKHNPESLVKNWKTPILVVHGGKDFRVVETQGMGTFTTAQRKGIPSEFLYFPDENHWVLKPQNSILWHETVLGWLDRWTK